MTSFVQPILDPVVEDRKPIIRDEENNPFLVGSTPKRKIVIKKEEDEDKNPFLDTPEPTPKDWLRGGLSFIITPAIHAAKTEAGGAKRVPAYGIGIEVAWSQEDITSGRIGGMGAVARWTAGGELRKRTVKERLLKWMSVSSVARHISPVP